MLQKYVNGVAQEEYKQGELISDYEYDTFNECNEGNQNPDEDIEDFIYQWVVVSGTYVCDGTNKYQEEKEQRSSDNGATWQDTGRTRQGSLIEVNSTDCGYIEYIYRWITESGTYICDGNNKYQKQKEQRSSDNGVTWEDTGNTRRGSLIEADSEDCRYKTEYLTTEMLGSGTIKIRQQFHPLDSVYQGSQTPVQSSSQKPLTNIQYSKNNGVWTNIDYEQDISVANGDIIRWRANGFYSNGIYSTGLPANVNGVIKYKSSIIFSETLYMAYGNPKSLLYGSDFTTFDETNKTVQFYRLFSAWATESGYVVTENNNYISDASNLVIPDNIAEYCCYSMFAYCQSLTTAPNILPATTLANRCYASMFENCYRLTNAPELPATTLSIACYANMFRLCVKVNYIKAMFTTTPSSTYTNNWVKNVSSTGTFVKNSAATWDVSGVNGIPDNWTVENASS